MRYDCIIIGSGPAGLSAAMNLQIHQKKFLWFGNANLSEKVEKAEEICNYPGFAKISGKELQRRFLEHKEAMGLSLREAIVSSIYPMGTYYSLIADNEIYETKTILLATGVTATKQYPGETDFLGRGISYCATCDGNLYRDKTIAVVATSRQFETEIRFLTELAQKVYLFPYYKDCTIEDEKVEKMTAAIRGIYGGFRVESMELADERILPVDGIFLMRNSIAPTTLLPGIAIEEGHIAVDRRQRTSLAGVFAAGDCTGKPYQYTKAVGEGNVAAHSIVDYLGENECHI